MDCPHCHENLVSQEYEHISVSTCMSCGGIWLNPSQLSQIITMREQFSPEQIQASLKTAHAGISPAELTPALPCPQCSQTMQAINYDYSSGVIVHICPQGQGLWFDKNTLEEVQIFMEHWDDEENTRKTELLGMLKKESDDENATENTSKPSLPNVLNPLFMLFENLKKE